MNKTTIEEPENIFKQNAHQQASTTDLNKTAPDNIFLPKPFLNADLASLDQMSEDDLARVPFSMPKAGFDLKNPILTLPEEEEDAVSQKPIIRSKSSHLQLSVGRQSYSSQELKEPRLSKPNYVRMDSLYSKTSDGEVFISMKPDQSSNEGTVDVNDQNPADSELGDINYDDYDDLEDFFGLCEKEQAVFGDRAPTNHEKLRIISKTQSQLYWLATINDNMHKNKFFIEQQIPKNLPNLEEKLKFLKNEQDFFKTIEQQGMEEFVFVSKGIINDDDLEDIWSLYKIDGQEDAYTSLAQLLFKVSFDSRQKDKMYDIEHDYFYQLLSQENGLKHLATLIYNICLFLDNMSDLGMIYGNLKAENIMIKLNKDKTQIQNVKFIDFGTVVNIDNTSEMLMPVQVDHFPPELLKYYIKTKKFSDEEH